MPCRSGDEPWDFPAPTPEMVEESRNRKEKEAIIRKNLSSYSKLENEAFTGFMAVFLCKAMELVVINDLTKHVWEDLEWWFKEHKFRDNNNNKRLTPKDECNKRLKRIKEHYKVH